MNPRFRKGLISFSVVVAVSVAGLVGGGCSGAAPEDDSAKIKMATDLTQCRNDNSNLKDKIAELSTELQKLKAQAQAANTITLPAVDVKAQPQQGEQKHVDGSIAPDQITKTVKANSGALRSCYEGGLKRNPNLQYVSMVNVRFHLKNTGTAADVGFSPHTDQEMEKCMAATMEKWHFPTFQGDPVAFEQPVNLVAK